jgi:hypothetical protein
MKENKYLYSYLPPTQHLNNKQNLTSEKENVHFYSYG